MKIKSHISALIALFATVAATGIFSACNDSKSYAELLTSETKAVNAFLANQIVINDIPEDSVFKVGPDAPYYRIDPEGNLYMQVLDAGDDERVESNQMVYFSYMRYDLREYAKNDSLPDGAGTADDMEYESLWFRYNNYSLQASAQYGTGIQQPLKFLGFNSRVNLIIKSQLGFTSEIAYVMPFLYDIRYFKGQI